MRILLFFGVLLLVGCAKSSTSGFCNYDLSSNGWSQAPSPPDLIRDSKNVTWFRNAAGDFLVCPELVEEGVCGNVYEVYEKTNGGYEYKEIVCME